MAENSGISWTDHSFNPWIGCTKVSPACDHCYAERLADTRMHIAEWGPGKARYRTLASNWRLPLKWNTKAGLFDRRQRVFCASLADVFDNEVDPAWRADLFDLIRATPNLDWLLLTKRIGNVERMVPPEWLKRDVGRREPNRWPSHAWLGITVINQEEADRDIPKLLELPARVRFLSIEPMLGPIDLSNHLWKCCGELEHTGVEYMGASERACCRRPLERDALHWVIAGGESGPHARPAPPDWFRSLAEQCTAAGVAFFMKQMGGHPNKRADMSEFPTDLQRQEFPNAR